MFRDSCLACEVEFKHGDKYLPDIGGGSLHFACLGPEAECYVDLETGVQLDAIPDPLIWDDEAFRGWLALDATTLPDGRCGPFLTTNNPDARDAHGMPSHVWLVARFHADQGEIVAFTDGDRKLHGLTLFRAAFPGEANANSPSAASAGKESA